MNDYIKGITLSKEELKALNGCIEEYIYNTQRNGCGATKFDLLTKINSKITKAKK